MIEQDKNRSIKQSLSDTRLRRLSQDIKVFEVKIDEDHLSKTKKQCIKKAFIEAKWIYNFCLTSEDIFYLDYKRKTIPVKIFNTKTSACDLTENRSITLGSQIRQSIYEQVKQNITNLSKAKKKGQKIGCLKFKKEINCIHLKQFGTTYKIKNTNYVSIQGIGKLKVIGLEQCLNKGYEFGCANLIKKPSGYYLKITCFINKNITSKSGGIGIDFGVKNTVNLSNGNKYNFEFKIPNSLTRKQRKLSKKQYGSKNYIKQLKKLKKQYEKLGNKKDDAANQFVSELKKYEKVVIQDENLSGWQAGGFGKQISTSILGRIKNRIKRLSTSVVIDKFLPTTKICPNCINENVISLNQRTFSCSCGFTEDRDTKAAKTILCLGNKNKQYTSKELRSLPVEELTAIFKDYIFENKSAPMKQEAAIL